MGLYEVFFIILFVLLMGTSAGLVLLGFVRLETVKAGKVSKTCPRVVFMNRRDNGRITVDGRTIDVSGMLHLAVCGNSMRDYDIWDGQEIYAQRIVDDADKRNINDYPVVVFDIVKAKFYDSQYKLRKFVGYGCLDYSDDDWEAIYEKNKARIKINKEEFVRKCLVKAENLKSQDVSCDVVLSETYDEEAGKHDYSLHPVNTVFAIVEYAA